MALPLPNLTEPGRQPPEEAVWVYEVAELENDSGACKGGGI